MAAVIGLSPREIDEVCRAACAEDEPVQPANYNAPVQTVIAGAVPAVQRAMDGARAAGAKRVVPLKVSGAFHSDLMEYAHHGLAEAIEKAPIARAETPVVANVTARAVTEPDEIRRLLVEQLTRPVRWAQSMQTLADHGVDTVVETGPGNVLTGADEADAPRHRRPERRQTRRRHGRVGNDRPAGGGTLNRSTRPACGRTVIRKDWPAGGGSIGTAVNRKRFTNNV